MTGADGPRDADPQVAVVTGGASGFGLALAEECGARGMAVALLDLDGARAAEAATALAATHGVDAVGLTVDVADGASVEAAAAAVGDRYGHADVVISNVGVALFGSVESFTDDEWRWVLDVNVVGAARTARAFLPLLRRASSGRLAFTSSSSALAPASRMAAYQASKFALWGLAETLRIELADEPITVTTLFPSGMATRHLESSTAAQPSHLGREVGDPADFEAMLASNPGLLRDVTTAEVAARAAISAVLGGERYCVTHGDVVAALDERAADLGRAATAARNR